jgi:hypothetical protein
MFWRRADQEGARTGILKKKIDFGIVGNLETVRRIATVVCLSNDLEVVGHPSAVPLRHKAQGRNIDCSLNNLRQGWSSSSCEVAFKALY